MYQPNNNIPQAQCKPKSQQMPFMPQKPVEQRKQVNNLDYRSYLNNSLRATGDEIPEARQTSHHSEVTSIMPSNVNINQVDPKHGIVDYYIHLDSQNKETTSNVSRGEIAFSIKSLSSNLDTQLSNIIEMEILNPLYLQKIDTDASLPDFYFMRKAYITVKELSTSQSVQSNNNKKYHFDFDVEDAGVTVRLVPLNPKIVFPAPISLSSALLTFAFTVPMNFKEIPLQDDILYFYPDATSNANMYAASARLTTLKAHNIHVTYGGSNQINTPTYGAGLALSATPPNEWVACYVTDFLASDATVTTKLTSPTGHMITKLYSNNTVEIGGATENNVDFSTPANLRLPYSPLALIAGAPARFSTVGTGFNYNHHLTVGDRVFFNSFASSDTDINALVNSSTGWVVNFVDVTLTGTQFTVMDTSNTTLDLSTLVSSVTSTFYMSPTYVITPPVINIALRKTTFSMRFRTVKDSTTNFIYAV